MKDSGETQTIEQSMCDVNGKLSQYFAMVKLTIICQENLHFRVSWTELEDFRNV